jgi:hypothetical protein
MGKGKEGGSLRAIAACGSYYTVQLYFFLLKVHLRVLPLFQNLRPACTALWYLESDDRRLLHVAYCMAY